MKKRIIYDPERFSWRARYFITRGDYLAVSIALAVIAALLLAYAKTL